MSANKAILTLLASFGLFIVVSSQTQIEHLKERDGLSYRWVLDITQDQFGFLWLATYDGLNRYDGKNFVTYKHSDSDTNSISSSQIAHVAADMQGGIWTYGYDFVFNRIDLSSGQITKTSTYSENGNLYSGRIGNMMHFSSLSNGDFIVLFQEKDLNNCSFWRYNPDINVFEFLIRVPTASTPINYFSERQDGKIWLWGLGVGYYLVDIALSEFIYYPIPNAQHVDSDISVPVDIHNRFWYPLDTFQEGNAALSSFQLPADIGHASIRRIRHDNASGIWMNCKDSLLLRFDPTTQTLERFADPVPGESTHQRTMQRFFRDQAGTFWTGHFHGAIQFKNYPRLFHSYSLASLLATNAAISELSVRDVIQYGEDKLIIRSQSYALYIVDLQTNLIQPLDRNSLSSESDKPKPGIQSLLIDENGFLWTNQDNKLVRTNPKTHSFRVFNGPHVETQDHPRIFQDRKRRIWWCSRTGIYVFDKEDSSLHQMDLGHDQSIHADFRYASYHQIEDRIYGTYERGVYEIDCTKEKSTYHEIFGENEGDYVTTAILNWRDEFWLSTNKGLVRYDPSTGKRSTYSRHDGLPSDIVYSTLASDSDLWLATHNGLCRLDPYGLRVTTYYQDQGLPDNEFNRWSYLKATDGRLFFGGLNGLVGFDPAEFETEGPAGQLSIIEFSKYNQKLDKLIPVLDNPYEKGKEIEVSPYERTLSIEYILPMFKDGSMNQYFHMLDGLENDWIDDGNRNETRYIQIPPGDYTFRVKAMGPNGEPSINEISIPITVRQYWYLRWWAIVGYVVFGALVVSTLYRFQLSRRLDRQETKRIRELEAVKSRMFTNITHEFRTPLTVMLGMNQAVKGYANEGDMNKVEQSTEMIDRNARNLLDLVNQMLDVSKLESGILDTHNQHADILAYLRYRLEAFNSLAAEKQINLQFDSDETEILMDFDPDRISHIINNLISNALKFTPEEGNIYVSLRIKDSSEQVQFLELTVRDTGVGIEADKIEHIFDRFYQVKSYQAESGEGTGIGLSLVREIVNLLGGSIVATSAPGAGTEFTVVLPMTHEVLTMPPSKANSLNDITPTEEGANIDGTHEQETPPLVLVVEDNADVMHYISITIDHSYQVITASNGREGNRMAIEFIPDVIISDVMMPDMDGYQLCKVVKTDERTSHIPVILLTAKADHKSRLAGLEHGADVYLSKPFDQSELLVRLRNLLNLRTEIQRRYAQIDFSQTESGPTNIEEAFIIKLRSIIAEHLEDDNFDISMLCKAIHVSRAQLHRKLVALTGNSTSHLIRQVQMETATELLQNSDLTVSEVAFRAGFKTPAHFSRVFSASSNMSPSDYRKTQPWRR